MPNKEGKPNTGNEILKKLDQAAFKAENAGVFILNSIKIARFNAEVDKNARATEKSNQDNSKELQILPSLKSKKTSSTLLGENNDGWFGEKVVPKLVLGGFILAPLLIATEGMNLFPKAEHSNPHEGGHKTEFVKINKNNNPTKMGEKHLSPNAVKENTSHTSVVIQDAVNNKKPTEQNQEH